MDNEQLTLEIARLNLEIETLKRIINKDNFSDLQIFNKQVQFKGNVGFWGKTPAVQQDSTGLTTVAQVLTLLKNLGLVK